jgi:biopolymer transport protein TolQ
MQGIIGGLAVGGQMAAFDAMSLIWQASWVVQLVILVLVALSVISWTIIAFKWRELRRAAQDSEAFLEVYHDGSLDAAFEAARDLDRSPLSTIFLSAYSEMHRMARFAGKSTATALEPAHVRALSRHIRWAGSEEELRLERGLNFLATTGSAAPFIGLFGTVIGVINAFQNIGMSGSASLAVVAPGIAEALTTTGLGLVAAIPAVWAHNSLGLHLRRLGVELDRFAADFLTAQDRTIAASES